MRSKLLLLSVAAVCMLTAASVRAQSYAITNARIVTVSGATIDKGTIVVRNGLIQAVGSNVAVPADARVFDATGLTAYPGFIDALTNLGYPRPTTTGGPGGGGQPNFQQLQQQAQQAQQAGAAASNSNYRVGLRPEESAAQDIRAGEAQFETNRNAGFTTALSVGRTGIFNGQSAVINLAGDSVSEMIIRSQFGEHVTMVPLGGDFPNSLMGSFAAFRQILLDAQRLQEWQRLYAANPKGMRRPESDKSLEALFPVLNGKMPAVFNANTEREIVRALDLIREFKLNGVIAGGQEAWKQAARLKSQNVSVLYSLNLPKRTTASAPDADPEDLETLKMRAEAPKGPSRLTSAGVKVAFQSTGVTNIADFFLNAARVVEGGLSRDAAVRAMTLGSAEILGVDDRLGSIEPGKIANLTLVKGDLFGRDKFVPQVIVDGKIFEIKEPARPAGRGPGAGAGTPNAGGGTPTIQNVGGTYTITVDIPGQAAPGTLTMVQQGSQITGTLNVVGGSAAPINAGRVTADGFSFTSSVLFAGNQLDITVSGSVSGNNISGIISSPAGNIPFTGTKNP